MKIQRALHAEYLDRAASLVRLQRAMLEQMEHLVSSCGLTLGVPIESRVKSWDSIVEKFARKRLKRGSLETIHDLVGIRVIFLFQRDLARFHEAVSKTFKILAIEDVSRRLADAQFGYQSQHYILSFPSDWERIPSMAGLTGQTVELQVRTLAQHIWAAASHKLQYKHEETVPPQLRRAIHRASALLEMVDLEFDRVLVSRDNYVESQAITAAFEDSLNATVLEAVLDSNLPAANKDADAEDYADLLADLDHFNVKTRGALIALLAEQRSAVERAERAELHSRLNSDEDGDYFENEDELCGERESARIARGVFFTHVGLVRQALCEKFDEKTVQNWLLERNGDA